MPFGVGVFVRPKTLVTVAGVVVVPVALVALLAAPLLLTSGDPGGVTFGILGLALWAALIAWIVRRRTRERERQRLLPEARAHAAARRLARHEMTAAEKLAAAEHASAKAAGVIGHGGAFVARKGWRRLRSVPEHARERRKRRDERDRQTVREWSKDKGSDLD